MESIESAQAILTDTDGKQYPARVISERTNEINTTNDHAHHGATGEWKKEKRTIVKVEYSYPGQADQLSEKSKPRRNTVDAMLCNPIPGKRTVQYVKKFIGGPFDGNLVSDGDWDNVHSIDCPNEGTYTLKPCGNYEWAAK